MTPMAALLAVAVSLAFGVCVGAPEGHRVRSLPGVSWSLPFDQYAGTVTIRDPRDSHEKHMFYWLTLSERHPSSDPLVLWLQGGPGASSIVGLLTENGPFRVTSDKRRLDRTPQGGAWNRVANVLYVDSPVGVGLSWSAVKDDLVTNDTRVAQDLVLTLEALLSAPFFPELAGNPLYLAGESYAGHYIPAVARELIVRPSSVVKLSGFLIGNPMASGGWFQVPGEMDPRDDSWPYLHFMHGRGFIPTDLYARATTMCGWHAQGLDCPAWPFVIPSTACQAAINDCLKVLPKGVNLFNIDAPSCLPNRSSTMFVPDPCVRQYLAPYINQQDVLEAIHASGSRSLPYATSNDFIGDNYDDASMHWDVVGLAYPLIFAKRPEWRILIYSGTSDSCICFDGTERWVRCLGLSVVRDWRPWYAANGQLGGMIIDYNGMTLLTVKGSGHMVPFYTPDLAFSFFEQWLDRKL